MDHDLLVGLLCGGIANLVPSVLTNPFDVLKIRLQVQPLPVPGQQKYYRSFAHAAQTIVREEGWRGLVMPGIAATCLRELSYSSFRFGMYQPVKNGLHDLFYGSKSPGSNTLNQARSSHVDAKGSEPFLIKLVSAVSIGCFGSALANPTDLVKIRLQREAGHIGPNGHYTSGLHKGLRPTYENTFHAFYKIVKDESFWGLYKGVQATAIRASLVTGTQLSTYDETKYLLKKYRILEEGFTLHIVGSIVAGLAATTAGAPADIIKTRLLSQQDLKSNSRLGVVRELPQYRGFMHCFASMIRNEGPMSLFRGWLPSYMRLAPHFIIALPLYEQLRKAFGLDAM